MSFLDQVLALLRWKRMIAVNTLLVAAVAVVVSLLLPQWYRGVASIFPPEEEGFSLTNLSSFVAFTSMQGAHSRLPIWATPSDVYAAVLKSRTVGEAILDRFRLMEVYEEDDRDEALKALRKRTTVKIGSQGIVSVLVEDRSRERAAEMANAYLEVLDEVNRRRRHSSARLAREFLDGRLERARRDMAAAEDTLRRVQERTGVLAPEGQLDAVLAAVGAVQSELVIREVQLEILSQQVGPDHPDRAAMAREVAALRRKMDALDLWSGAPTGGPAASAGPGPLEIPLRDYPERNIVYLRALREVKIQESLYEFLAEQYEAYRIQETRDTPTVQVLDRAEPPTRRVRPIRWLIVSTAALLAFLGSVLVAALLERIARLRREAPERFETLRRIAAELRLERVVERL